MGFVSFVCIIATSDCLSVQVAVSKFSFKLDETVRRTISLQHSHTRRTRVTLDNVLSTSVTKDNVLLKEF